MTVHDAFTPQGCEGKITPYPVVTAEADAVWIDLYHAVTSEAGRYVQGGGCTPAEAADNRQPEIARRRHSISGDVQFPPLLSFRHCATAVRSAGGG